MANYPYQNYNMPQYPSYQTQQYQTYQAPQNYFTAPQQTVPNTVQTNASQQPAFICCPVTSREEAVAYRVEAFGPAVIMPDFGHGMIYYKRFNNETALADFHEFKYQPKQTTIDTPEEPVSQPINYSAVAEAFTERLESIESKMDILQDLIENIPHNKPTASKGGNKE